MATRAQQMQRARPGDILIVIHDFEARTPDELGLSKGDRIELLVRDDDFGDGWFLGKHTLNGLEGLFPEVYTTPWPSQQVTRNSLPPRKSEPAVPAEDTDSHNEKTLPVPPEDTHQDTRASVMSTASAPSMSGAYRTSTASSTPRSMGLALKGQLNSPVMDQTLSVIDEHITDMSTPRHSLIGRERRTNDSESEYSARLDHRLSYINGHETDEEEHPGYTAQEVLNWSPERVAEYLEDVGVEKRHCEIFQEQEISGEVLLGMDQSSIFLKEFELGSVGKRLKTWHKIKAMQEEVSQPKQTLAAPSINTQRSISDYGTTDDSVDSDRPRSISTSAVLPRIPSVHEGSPNRHHPFTQPSQRPDLATPTGRGEHHRRPSAASVRNMNHNRRHSSIDYASGTPPTPGTPTLKSGLGYNNIAHKKQGSLDRTWTMSSQQTQSSTALGPRSATAASHVHSASTDGAPYDPLRELDMTVMSAGELDRGYFSGGDVEGRKARNVLRKRESPSHSRVSSFQSQAGKATRKRSESARQDRFGSTDDSFLDSLAMTAPAINRRFFGPKAHKGEMDLSKPMIPARDTRSPTVTKLEYGDSPSIDAIAASSPVAESDNSSLDKTVPSPATFRSNFNRIRVTGLRAISDAVTGSERALATSPDKVPSPRKESPLSPRTEASTPSGTGKYFDYDDVLAQKASNDSSGAGTPIPVLRPRRKSKKETSAYSRGLEKKSPAEQVAGCDFSGWMKKRSSNLMTTWKPRFFVLRGRRLSYYYSENDTEEKGLIDISFHRVLPANNERLTGLHATLTGATHSPTSPNHSHHPSIDASDPTNQSTSAPSTNSTPTIATLAAATVSSPALKDPTGTFIFKLVPPRSGLSKAVNFTKPTVHYFAVDNLATGRLWMAALMKATIDRDETASVVTTYKESTISLSKARAMRQRPPALRDLEEGAENNVDPPTVGTEGSKQSMEGASVAGDSSKSKVDSGAGLGIGMSPGTPGTMTDEKGSITTDGASVGRKSGEGKKSASLSGQEAG
ncbi:hypothetical protein P152DRAFT_297056 [Eremomyces bilateralis CBS 781.70]|uniref:Polarized growth protein Boi2 n=1 Tax=Eremomyces bilateralis CBS 781.70 TaxID=1392243 RepID=A0A6G1G733_9PEZI|nr:uncharacterized protein P152DRAFT_297056 [Eremomyces bilateralis CBS 781.70]KAF1813895.1 hypothetical protein P152DRAFT_297056 [Eremomyces bilateralis CBS 781.70]